MLFRDSGIDPVDHCLEELEQRAFSGLIRTQDNNEVGVEVLQIKIVNVAKCADPACLNAHWSLPRGGSRLHSQDRQSVPANRSCYRETRQGGLPAPADSVLPATYCSAELLQ